MGPMSVRDLSQSLSISEREVRSHLGHVMKTAAARFKLVIDPPVCNGCGFRFENRKKFHKPSRCPKCRAESISSPMYQLLAK